MNTAVANQPAQLSVMDLGQIQYADCWELQKELQKKRIADLIPDTLIVCEHEPVVTFGRSSKAEQLLISKDQLAERGIKFFEIERGGAVTYHGPGQLVFYPILDLKQHKRDVDWYMRKLEQVVINNLQNYSITGERNSGFTGVWVKTATNKISKIAAIGVRLSRWCSMHGFAVNVLDCLDGFKCIVPCGIDNVDICSIESVLRQSDTSDYSDLSILMQQVKRSMIDDFRKVFNYSVPIFEN